MKQKRLMVVIAAIVSIVCVFGAQTTALAADDTGLRVIPDETYIKYAVVSELPVTLTAKIRNSVDNFIYGREVAFTVISGSDFAEIRDGNQLYVNAVGEFTVRAALSDNAAVYKDTVCQSVDLTFSNVQILSRIENITVYSQPINLIGRLEVGGIDFPEVVHGEVCFKVISGPAEIYSDTYLRFTGEGTVVIKAYSRYDENAFVEREIVVTDPDKGLVTEETDFTQGNLADEGGCGATAVGGTLGILALLGAIVIRKKH